MELNYYILSAGNALAQTRRSSLEFLLILVNNMKKRLARQSNLIQSILSHLNYDNEKVLSLFFSSSKKTNKENKKRRKIGWQDNYFMNFKSFDIKKLRYLHFKTDFYPWLPCWVSYTHTHKCNRLFRNKKDQKLFFLNFEIDKKI